MHIQERPNVLRIIFIKLFELVNIGIIDTAQHTQRRIVIIVLYKFRRQEMGERGRFGTPAGSVIQGEKNRFRPCFRRESATERLTRTFICQS